MKPSHKLVRAFRKVARILKTTPEVYWYPGAARCNCGILAQVLLNRTEESIQELLEDVYDRDSWVGSWLGMTTRESDYCKRTGLPVATIFKELLAHGLSLKDLAHLEHNEVGIHSASSELEFFLSEANKMANRLASDKKRKQDKKRAEYFSQEYL